MGWRILLQVHDEVLMEVRLCQLPEPATTHERASARPLVEYPTAPYMPYSTTQYCASARPLRVSQWSRDSTGCG